MITRQELVSYATMKNIELIEEAPATHCVFRDDKLNRYNTESEHRYRIGIRYSKYCYYWFYAYPTDKEIKENQIDFYFEHKYSQRNGSTDKRWSIGYKAINRIINTLTTK
jgi:3D (Asp-Asp-Asp) domain-containing protein